MLDLNVNKVVSGILDVSFYFTLSSIIRRFYWQRELEKAYFKEYMVSYNWIHWENLHREKKQILPRMDLSNITK